MTILVNGNTLVELKWAIAKITPHTTTTTTVPYSVYCLRARLYFAPFLKCVGKKTDSYLRPFSFLSSSPLTHAQWTSPPGGCCYSVAPPVHPTPAIAVTKAFARVQKVVKDSQERPIDHQGESIRAADGTSTQFQKVWGQASYVARINTQLTKSTQARTCTCTCTCTRTRTRAPPLLSLPDRMQASSQST